MHPNKLLCELIEYGFYIGILKQIVYKIDRLYESFLDVFTQKGAVVIGLKQANLYLFIYDIL